MWHQYGKNDNKMVLSAPIAQSNLLKYIKVFPLMLAVRIKEKGKDLCKFYVHLCLYRQTIKQGKDFDFLYYPTVSYTAYCIVLCYTDIMAYNILGIDEVKYFQSDSIDIKMRLHQATSSIQGMV